VSDTVDCVLPWDELGGDRGRMATGRWLATVPEVSWWSRFVDDLRRPESPTGRDELVFLTVSAVTIVAAAQLTEAGSALAFLSLLGAGIVFVLRGLIRRLPSELFVVLVAAGAGGAVAPDGELEIGFFLIVIAVLYGAWHSGSLARALLMLVVGASVPWLLAEPLDSDIGWTPWVSACVFTFVMGRNLRRQQILIDRLEATQHALAEQSVLEERRRMARELHDLAGHTLAAMMLHVTGARHVLRRDLDEAERALHQAEAVGRSSLGQIRATVTMLRTDEHGTDAALPGSAELSDLVDEYRHAGLRVTTSWTSPLDIDGPLGTAIHRITREALANVALHAPSNRVDVTVDVLDSEGMVRLAVVDHGTRPASPPGTSGFGLVGMRERARALGGEVEAGPTDDGWRVEARLPIADTDAGVTA
jgi:signal transduction histidine kinase